jgi:hypothetical protein
MADRCTRMLNWISQNKAALPLLIVPIPYMGGANQYNAVVAFMTVGILILWGSNLKIYRHAALASILTAISIFMSAMWSIFLGREINIFSFTDFIFVFLWLSVTSYLCNQENNKKLTEIFIAAMLALGLLNITVSMVVKFSLFDLSYYYGETEAYDMSYTSIRSVGIIGQPGKMALFSALSILGLGFAYSVASSRAYKFVALISAYIFLLTSFLSLSRTGITLSVLAIFAFGKKIAISTLCVVALILYLLVDDATILLLLRATDSSDFDASSLEYRNILREYAFKYVFENPGSMLLGFGPSKESADMLPLPIPGHSLRYPDSSITLVVFRYGILGAITLAITLYTTFALFGAKLKTLFTFEGSLLLLITLVAANLDPLWHDPKIVIIYIYTLFLFSLSVRRKFKFMNLKENRPGVQMQ